MKHTLIHFNIFKNRFKKSFVKNFNYIILFFTLKFILKLPEYVFIENSLFSCLENKGCYSFITL